MDLKQVINILTTNTNKKKLFLLKYYVLFFSGYAVLKKNHVFLLFIFLEKTTNIRFLSNRNHVTSNFYVNFFFDKFKYASRLLVNNFEKKKTIVFDKQLLISPKYNSSSVDRYMSTTNLNNIEFQFLRKNKVFNKGRYSRCRQNYRLGVYLCMYLSVVCIFGMYFWFYKFSFNFTYLWWLFIGFVFSFFIPKIIKYRLYDPRVIFFKFYGLLTWSSQVVLSFFN